jgi:uncharacterized protein (DUF302 family)
MAHPLSAVLLALHATSATLPVQHIHLSKKIPFDEVCSRIEARAGRINLSAFESLLKEKDSGTKAREYVHENEGPLGLMIFSTANHGQLLELTGHAEQAKQYVIGNPLIAMQMTRESLGAGLYAPLRIYVSRVGDGETAIDYDLPSSLFAQFKNTEVDKVADQLDAKLEKLVVAAFRGN